MKNSSGTTDRHKSSMTDSKGDPRLQRVKSQKESMDNTSLIGPTLAKQSSQKLTLAKQKHGKNEDLVDDQELKSDGANDDDECSEQNKLQRAVPKRSL